MNFELAPVSPEGVLLVELAEKHATEFAATADQYDRENSFPFPHWDAMRGSGFLAASIPTDLGGKGVTAVHDLVVAVSRLARGDGSIAIGAAMHLTAFWYFSRLRPAEPTFAAQVRLLLRRCARGRVVACVAISEPGRSLGRPRATARQVGDDYRIDGRKAFCTGSPVGTVFLCTVRITGGDGAERLGFALVPRETPGLTVLRNWDALGMRASGSHDVVFDSCPVPGGMVMASGALGVLSTAMMPLPMVGSLLLVGAALGIAERAQDLLVAAVARDRDDEAGRTWAVRPAAQALVAENEVDLAVSRATVGRVAALLDERLLPGPAEPPRSLLHELAKEIACANIAVKRAAMATVDRALTVSGGRGYLSSNPLSRLYRDVRAGPFMRPFSALDALEYIGRITLGLDTELDI